MRLIDADSLKENLSKWLKQVDPTYPSDIPPMDDIIVSTIMTIEEEPTIDAVPTIRCKDCKYWYAGENINYCRKFWDDDGEPKLYRCTADDFCSRAERKEE